MATKQPVEAARASFRERWEAFCQEGPNKGKPGPCPKPKAAPAPKSKPAAKAGPSARSKGKPAPKLPPLPLPTLEHLQARIAAVKAAGADKTAVDLLAISLGRARKADLQELKRTHGLWAGGNKSALAAKIAVQATQRLTERQAMVREARKAGVRPADLFALGSNIHFLNRQFSDSVGRMLADTRKLYAARNPGRALTRSMKAFDGGDHTKIPNFDVIARTMADRFPELLGAHGYDSGDNDERPAAAKLFDFLAAGRPPAPRREDAWRKALDALQGQPRAVRGQRYRPSDEPIPFSERRPASVADRLRVIAGAMIDAALAGNRARLLALRDMAAEIPVPPDGLGAPGSAVTKAAARRVQAQQAAFVRAKLAKLPRGGRAL